MQSVRRRPDRPGTRCAWCHEAAGAEALVACGGCATLVHAACSIEATRCPTLGCREEVAPHPITAASGLAGWPGGAGGLLWDVLLFGGGLALAAALPVALVSLL